MMNYDRASDRRVARDEWSEAECEARRQDAEEWLARANADLMSADRWDDFELDLARWNAERAARELAKCM